MIGSGKLLQRAGSKRRYRYAKTGRAEIFRQHLREAAIVFNQQDAFGHMGRHFARRRIE